MIDKSLPLRERKKLKTRAALIDTAAHLFLTQGYEETTLEQIAEQAEVHVQTLLRYFPNKEKLAMAPMYDTLQEFRERLEASSDEMEVLIFWRQWVEGRNRTVAETDFLGRLKMYIGVSSLRAARLRIWQEYEDILTEALANEINTNPETDLQPRLMATMLVGGYKHVMRQWAYSDGKLDLLGRSLEVVDFAIEHFPNRATRC